MRGEFDTQLLLRRDAEQKLDATYQTKNGANGTNGINSTGSHDDNKPNVPWTTSDQSFVTAPEPTLQCSGVSAELLCWREKRVAEGTFRVQTWRVCRSAENRVSGEVWGQQRPWAGGTGTVSDRVWGMVRAEHPEGAARQAARSVGEVL